ncbi:MAG: hypothetical protein DMH00_06445, partial [Acidobacteria bacterium]
MPRAWKKAFFVTLYGLLLFAVLEIGARAALSWSPIFRRVARHSNAAWRLEWVARRASPASGPYAFDVFDRIRGWAPKPLLHEVTAFHGKRLSTNSEGLRGTSEVRYEKTPGRRRILALGDSFTFGE